MKLKALSTATAVALVMSASSAFANTLDFQNIAVSWSDVMGGTLQSNVSAGGSASLRWGANSDSPDFSGYDFAISSDPVPSPAAMLDQEFTLGTFTHLNQPIVAGTAITSAVLNISGDIFLNGNLEKNAVFSFTFDHNETPNSPGPCEGGDTVPCGDLVTASMLSITDTFDVDGVLYTMSILGFIPEGETEIDNIFFSDEGLNNSADVVAVFTSEVPAVPLPAGMLLMGTALAGFGVMRRRKKAA